MGLQDKTPEQNKQTPGSHGLRVQAQIRKTNATISYPSAENDEGLRNSPAYTTPTESQMAQCSAIAMPACLPTSADFRRRSLYLPAPVSTILFTEHHDPSHRRYHQDGSAAWTRSGNMLDIAARHSLPPPVLRSPPPMDINTFPTSPRDETQLSIVRTDRSTAPRPSDMPSLPPAAPIYDIQPHGTHGACLDTEHPYRPTDCLAASSLGLSRCGHALTPAQTEARHWPEEGGRRIRAGAVRDQLSSEHSS